MDTLEKTGGTTAGHLFPGSAPMARINGDAMRRLRERKGLTQLYLATVIGVTTDTISRWENRRYPSIKLDNAERLAQALEVELEAILERDNQGAPPLSTIDDSRIDSQTLAAPASPPPPSAVPPVTACSRRQRPTLPLVLGGFSMAALVAGLGWWLFKLPNQAVETGAVERILPGHVPAGQTFPVLIRVSTGHPETLTLILKETIPPGCQVVGGEPLFTSSDGKSGVVKWISRIDSRGLAFSYLVQAPVKAVDGDQLRFDGAITLNPGDHSQVIAGAATMTIAPYHWADLDRNGAIDDGEILAVYDRYSALRQLDFGRDLIDAIWAGTGYSWDRKKGKYVVPE